MPVYQFSTSRQSDDNGGTQPPGPPDMDARISKLEAFTEKASDRLMAIEKDIALIKSDLGSFKSEAFRSFATRADVTEAKNSIIMWVVSAILLAQLLPPILKKFGL